MSGSLGCLTPRLQPAWLGIPRARCWPRTRPGSLSLSHAGVGSSSGVSGDFFTSWCGHLFLGQLRWGGFFALGRIAESAARDLSIDRAVSPGGPCGLASASGLAPSTRFLPGSRPDPLSAPSTHHLKTRNRFTAYRAASILRIRSVNIAHVGFAADAKWEKRASAVRECCCGSLLVHTSLGRR